MRTIQYGSWMIEVDVDKTREFYSEYKRKNTQANRNFAEYCKNLSADEKEFFENFGIDPICCEIEHIGVSRKKEFPCGGQYFVCGKYLQYPKEELLTPEELAANDFEDEREDNRVYIGIFQFEFQHEDYTINEIPENMPEGFICIDFWCEEMKWLLKEKPEERMYESPRFWEIHKIIGFKLRDRRQHILYIEGAKKEFSDFFDSLDIKVIPLKKKEIVPYKKEWIKKFTPDGTDIKEAERHCLSTRKYTAFLWHIFSYEILPCKEEETADEAFNKENKKNCVFISNVHDIAYRIDNAGNLTAEMLKQFIDVTVTAEDFSWTYSKTHEGYCGPYFYRRRSK